MYLLKKNQWIQPRHVAEQYTVVLEFISYAHHLDRNSRNFRGRVIFGAIPNPADRLSKH